MIEKIVTSKTRVKLLNLFLTHIDDRYYLRELERMLDESLSPLRRQLLKLVEMGILITEEEANLKYYKLNKSFEGINELRSLVLGENVIGDESKQPPTEIACLAARPLASPPAADRNDTSPVSPKRVKYDFAVLTVVSIFVLVTAVFVLYTSTTNVKQVAGLMFEAKPRTEDVRGLASNRVSNGEAKPTRPDEMVSKKWKVLPGNYPAFSTGETGGTKNSNEL